MARNKWQELITNCDKLPEKEVQEKLKKINANIKKHTDKQNEILKDLGLDPI